MNITHVQSYRHFCNKIWQGFSFVNNKLANNFTPSDQFEVSGNSKRARFTLEKNLSCSVKKRTFRHVLTYQML